jgi:hypothetical protein
MGHKRKHNRSVAHYSGPKPQPTPSARSLETLLLEAKIERKSQAAIMQELLVRHRGDIPVPVLTHERAHRLLNNTCSGAELARS